VSPGFSTTPTEVPTLLLPAPVHSGRRLPWASGPPSAAQVHLPFPSLLRPHHTSLRPPPILHARIIAAPTAALVRALLIFLNAWCDSSYASRVELACWSWPSAPLLPTSYPASCVAFMFIFAASIRCVFPLMAPPAVLSHQSVAKMLTLHSLG
jgi:hypothetical protein